MNVGDRVKLINHPDCVLPEIQEWLKDKIGTIVEMDWHRDWVVEFPDTPRSGNQFALDEHDMYVVEDAR